MAEQYLAAREAGTSFVLAALEHLTRSLPPAGTALDIGCEHVPAATLIRESLTVVEFPSGSFDVVVAFHSIIHVPRTEQPALIGHIHRWLRPGGAFLATWAAQAWARSLDPVPLTRPCSPARQPSCPPSGMQARISVTSITMVDNSL